MSGSKLWGGRFEKGTDKRVEQFTGSLSIDQRLADADLRASRAHAAMLTSVGVLTATEGQAIDQAFAVLREELREGKITWNADAEDVHSEIERLLTEKVGEIASQVHTARSRNDQVVTATRLYLKEDVALLQTQMRTLQSTIVAIAEKHTDTILPGTTHLQPAQPVSLAHHLMAYFWMLDRDRERFKDAEKRLDALPLGSGALAGTSFPINREKVRRELGFSALCENSLDAVSDRDFVAELLNAGALLLMHLSRLAEELVMWSAPAYGYVTLSDATTTGSSMMPQKKNPDVAELIRGRTGRLTGAWVGMMTVLKGLPLSYNRDLQEDKVHLFGGMDTARSCTELMELTLREATWNTDRMQAAVKGDFSNATDLADALARKGIPFRQAHEIVGGVVRACLKSGTALEALSLAELQAFCPQLDEADRQSLNPVAVMKARTSRGGTAPEAVLFQIQKAKELL